MVTLVTREAGSSPKGSPLTNAEIDNNFLNLDTGKQDKNTNLTAFSGLTGVADNLFYWNGDGTLGQSTYTALARTINGRATAALMRSDLGVNFGASADDVTPGNTLRVGDFGVGTTSSLADMNSTSQPTKFFITDAATLNKPAGSGVGWNIKRSATQAVQMLAEIGGDLKFRVLDTTFGNWNTIFHSGNVPTFGQNLLSATTAALARATLGLGSAALATLSTSVQDRVAGRVLRYGDLGIGTPIQLAANTDVDTLVNDGYFFIVTPVNAPGGIVNGYFRVLGYSDPLWCVQIWRPIGGLTYSRQRNNGVFSPWEVDLSTVNGATTLPGKLTLGGALDEAQVAVMTAAATLDIGAATSSTIAVNGSTTISSLGTAPSGVRRTIRFYGALTLTHSATLALPGGSDLTTVIGDYGVFLSYGGGAWECESYNRGDGSATRVISVARGGTAATTVAGARTNLGLGAEQVPYFAGLELTAATPAIDFHYGNGVTDYNVRLVNETSGELKVYGVLNATSNIVAQGGIVARNGVVQSYAPNAGSNAHFWMYGEAGQNRAVVYSGASGPLTLQTLGTDQMWIYNSGYVQVNQLRSNGVIYVGNTTSYLNTDGNIYGTAWGGWLSNVALLASNFRNHLANLRASELGAYVQAVYVPAGPVGLGSGVVGSNLRYSASQGSNPGASLPGNYDCCGFIQNALENTLWHRYV